MNRQKGMNVFISIVASALMLALGLLTDCKSSNDKKENNEKVYRLSKIDNTNINAKNAPTVTFHEEKVTGNGGCNHYFGNYSIDEQKISIGGLGRTMMACEQTIMQAEDRFLKLLENAATIKNEDAKITIITSDGATLLFDYIPPPEDLPLKGTQWQLQTVIDGDLAGSTIAGTIANITFSDTIAEGSDGCGVFDATYSTENNRLKSIDNLSASKTRCADESFSRQREFFYDVLQGFDTAKIDGHLLIIEKGNKGLHFRGSK